MTDITERMTDIAERNRRLQEIELLEELIPALSKVEELLRRLVGSHKQMAQILKNRETAND